MSRIVDIPAQFDDRGFEQFVAGIGAWPPEERLFLDARGVQWSTPSSILGLLTAGLAWYWYLKWAKPEVARRIGTIQTLSDEERERLTEAGILEVIDEAQQDSGDEPESRREKEPVAP